MMTAETAFARRLSNIPLTVEGKVIKILPDDTDGTHHQRFIIEIHNGHTILIANNLERAYRVPVKIGDKVEVHGSYVWNKYGGLIHNTHHDDKPQPNGQEHEDGYINFSGLQKPPDQFPPPQNE
jgi:hypothetical protein